MRNLKQVRPEDFDVATLMAAAGEGRLYLQTIELTDDELLAQCQREVLAYVSAIDDFATPEWRSFIHELWKTVVCDKIFIPDLVMKKKRVINRYFITAIVYQLQARNVYQTNEKVNQLKLHLTLEGITKKNSIYKSVVNYSVNLEQKKHLSALLENFQRV